MTRMIRMTRMTRIGGARQIFDKTVPSLSVVVPKPSFFKKAQPRPPTTRTRPAHTHTTPHDPPHTHTHDPHTTHA